MDDIFAIIGLAILGLAIVFLLYFLFCRLFNRVTVYEYEKAIHYRNGKYQGLLTPGVYWLLRLNNTVINVDLRPHLMTIPGQEVLSQGNIPVKISMLANVQTVDPVKAYMSEGEAMEKLYALLQLKLRQVAAVTTLEDFLQNRKEFIDQILAGIDSDIDALGFRLLKLDIKDISLSGEIKNGYIKVMTAKQEGLAALEKARGEMAALRSLANAAKILEGNPALYQLRLLQALGEGQGNTLVVGANAIPDAIKVQDNTPNCK